MERHERPVELDGVRGRPGPADTTAPPLEARRPHVQQVGGGSFVILFEVC